MNNQRSLNEQLTDLITLANRNGLYDAADWLVEQIATREIDQSLADNARLVRRISRTRWM